MKFVLFFVGIMLHQLMGADADRKEHFKACAQELKITKDMMKEARETKTFDKPEFKCLSACVAKRAGILEPGNKYNMDKVKDMVNKKFPDKAADIIKAKEECVAGAKGIADECDFARSIDSCFFKKIPDMRKKE
ncbi:general odorant-binding protein 72 [Leptopilina heterotoma]|uniref:general odorant-binding protein 72 n=1 Tax=Leptopilina heterotoma TaxID=63436 RepID=UPI001CA88B06|nr:general odorant-binding protein 72 [Leptopilina heterotoma]